MYKLLRDVYRLLNQARRLQLWAVLALMVAGALAEAFTLGAVVPFLSLLVQPELADRSILVSGVLNWLAKSLSVDRLLAASIAFVFIATLAAILRLTLTWASYKVVFGIGADLGALVFARVLDQPYSFHLSRNSSETLSAVEKVGLLTAGVLAPILHLSVSVVMVVSILSAMVWISPMVALVAGVVFGTLYLGISLWARKHLQANSQIIAINSSKRIQYLQEGMGAIRDIALEHNQKIYVEQFSTADRLVRNAQAVNATLSGAPKYVVESCAIVLVVVLANWLLNGPGGISHALPVLGALALGGQRLLPYVQTIYTGYAAYRGNYSSSLETLAILELPASTGHANVFDQSNDQIVPLSIELRNVSFGYGSSESLVLNDINLTIRAGDRFGFVGPTGGGKSTLLDIVMGLLCPSSGEIYIDGQLLSEKNLHKWQSNISHVPQTIFLCDKTIAENIALGYELSEIDQVKLADVVERAQLSEFIQGLPKGSQTRVGERGIQLSGGQRQRIGVARALYKGAKVLVLDEATSALDGETEDAVMQSIYQLNPDLVILIIAHRLSTLKQCHSIYRLDRGLLTKEIM